MKLTKSLDVALRILLRLAEEKRRLNARELSQKLKIPFNHAAKVLQALSKGGYLRTIKGKGGGVELAISAKKIFLQDVIQLMEGPIYLMECTVNREACFMSPRCRLRIKLKEAQENMIDVFKSTSIADLVPGRKG